MKKIVIFLMVLAFIGSLANAPRSHAAVASMVTGNVLFAIPAVACFSAGVSSIYLATTSRNTIYAESSTTEVVLFGSFLLNFFGFVILDESSNPKFQELSAESAAKLNASADEIEIYNSEIDLINASVEELIASNPKTIAEAEQFWNELKLNFSVESQNVLLAIAFK